MFQNSILTNEIIKKSVEANMFITPSSAIASPIIATANETFIPPHRVSTLKKARGKMEIPYLINRRSFLEIIHYFFIMVYLLSGFVIFLDQRKKNHFLDQKKKNNFSSHAGYILTEKKD